MAERVDALILGAGLSGLAAGIRLAHFGKRVLVTERHTAPGGLNSYYSRQDRSFDVGLHAMTNYAPRGARGAPLTKLLRQLRLKHQELELDEQAGSVIDFPSARLRFDNDVETLRASVAETFPGEADCFAALADEIEAIDAFGLTPPEGSARAFLNDRLREPLLGEMLLCPLMYYGNPGEDDMSLAAFAIMWKSIFTGGFARPRGGMRRVVTMLADKFRDAGGELRLGCGVERLEIRDGAVQRAVLDDGAEVDAGQVFSSAGRVETERLRDDRSEDVGEDEVGRLSFVELIACLDRDVRELADAATIVFFSRTDTFAYRRPDDLADDRSGVVCCPDTYHAETGEDTHVVRATAMASYPKWRELLGADRRADATPKARDAYMAAKKAATARLLEAAETYVPGLCAEAGFTDLFTPLTIRRYTGHLGGAVYGSPRKEREGTTDCANLFLLGTDQGFLGIVGSLLSGISVANLYGLR